MAAETLGVAPWDLAAQPAYWQHAALARRTVDADASAYHQRAAARKAARR